MLKNKYRNIYIVALREFEKSYNNVGMVLGCILIAGLIIAGSFYGPSLMERIANGPQYTIAVTSGANNLLKTKDKIENVADKEAALAMLRTKQAQVALDNTDGKTFIYAGPSIDEKGNHFQSIVSSITSLNQEKVLAEKGSNYRQELIDVAPIVVSYKGDSSMSNHGRGQLNSVYIVLLFLVFSVLTFSAGIGARVTEDKASRAVEILLSSISARELLFGKLIGNVAFGFSVQLIFAICFIVPRKIQGEGSTLSSSQKDAVIMLIAFTLGNVLFGALYAAAGALVSRTEDLQITQLPIMIVIFSTLYLPIMLIQYVDSGWMKLLAWIPPFSIGLTPLQFMSGNMSFGESLVSYLFVLVLCFLIIVRVAKIYEKSILRNGHRVRFRELWKAN